MSAPSNPSIPDFGRLGRWLTDPGHFGVWVGELARWPLSGAHPILVGLLAIGVLAAGVGVRRIRRARLGSGARQVRILCPPSVSPEAGGVLWAHLVGLLRPRWKRLLCGQPHLSFEYQITGGEGVTLSLWVPATIPPGLIERAITSAWPGARTDTRKAADLPLTIPATGFVQVLVGGKLRLACPEGLPIRSDYHGGDIARELLTAAADLDPGQAVCVQILARPVTGGRVRRALTGGRSGAAFFASRVVRGVLREMLDFLTPGAGTRRARYQGAVPADRQARMEDTTQARATITKVRGGHYETLIRYAAAVTVPAHANRETFSVATAVARGRAHAVAAVFGACADHNFYRRRFHLRLAPALFGRWLGRGDLLSVAELAGIAHLPIDPSVPGLACAGAAAVAPAATIPVGGAHTKPLGVADTGTGRPVALPVVDARHHLQVIGATGVGKSTLLAHLILDDAEAGRGQVVIDPKGDLITDVLTRLPRRLAGKVVLFDADSQRRPPCINPLDTSVEGLDLAVENLVAIFSRIYSRWWGPRTDDVLRASLRTLCARPGTPTLVDLVKLLTGESNLDRIAREVSDPVLRGFWASYSSLSEAGRAQIVAPLLNKLRAFLLRPFVREAIAAGESTLELSEVLDHGGICLARLPKGVLGEETTRLVGSLLVARTWQATTARASTASSARPDASLVLDEAHNFLHMATSIEDMLAEARGLHLALVLAHQNLGQLPRELREGISANARNKIIFSASPEDARDLARHTSPALGEHDLTHLDVHHAAARLLIGGQQSPPFTFTTRALPDPVPGRAREIRTAANAAREKRALSLDDSASEPTYSTPSEGDPRLS
ncbi:type IV secretory system conjugative DNA transfer family protein [Nocardia sp. CDC160]|uniref:type IV secretory system conjugative DNA transfer family protein n=1 Tax=Nocardia sp. CDC160 TaxID=3112166 RepID=UPI002DBB7734|nr:TraM recognition domain-containing protein [Nocardia sp. CDC160]MEC3915510.1 TraM recognition domain-containing protein [Nocardia sp. CDC160]